MIHLSKLKAAFQIIILLILNQVLFGQKININGFVKDSLSGEHLASAHIFEMNSKKGVLTNNFGYFNLDFESTKNIELRISYVGYQTKFLSLKTDSTKFITIYLSPGNNLNEIVIRANTSGIEKRTEMSVVSIPMKQIRALPSLGGEMDLIKSFQLLPGVQAGNEGSSDLNVRGGSPDQNLMLLDDVPLYYVNHLGGFVSTFNTDAIQSVKLIKGGFPARFGSRLSSIVDVRMKEGNMKEFHGSAMIGLVSAKISLEGPIKKDTSSYIISFRRLLYDILSRPLSKIIFDGASLGYHFYDLNLKANYILSKKDRIYFSFYSGDDNSMISLKDKSGDDLFKNKNIQKWGNLLAAFRWNHLFNHKTFGNLILTNTRYRYLTRQNAVIKQKTADYTNTNEFYSGINDLGAKYDLEYQPSSNFKIKTGASFIHHSFEPGITTYNQNFENNIGIDTTFGDYNMKANQIASYIENDFSLFPFLKANIGIRATAYKVDNSSFFSFEPRVLFNFLLNEQSSLKLSYAEMQQYVHLLGSSGAGMPHDLWMPSTAKIAPSNSSQYAIGYFKSFQNQKLSFSIEAYYKSLNNLIAYKEGALYLSTSSDWQDKVETGGKGNAYGLEFLLQKNIGKTTGWASYTLAKSDRQFKNINDGKSYPFKYDRRHDLSLVLIHHLSEKIDISGTWVYGSGYPITLAVGKYEIIDDFIKSPNNNQWAEEIYIYEGKNSFRMRDYHRLDLSINFHKKKPEGTRTWNISLFNVYNRMNPYFYYFEYPQDQNSTESKQLQLKQQSFFPIMPSFSYSFHF